VTVKNNLNNVFGHKHSLPFFQTYVNARPRKPGDFLDIYATTVTWLVLEAFPDFERHAQNGEMFCRLVAGLEPASSG
jgi:hypothetical protein